MNGLIYILFGFFLVAQSATSVTAENKTIPLKKSAYFKCNFASAHCKAVFPYVKKVRKIQEGTFLIFEVPDAHIPDNHSGADDEKWETASDAGLSQDMHFIFIFSDHIRQNAISGRWSNLQKRFIIPPPELA